MASSDAGLRRAAIFLADFARDRQRATEQEVLLDGVEGPRHATVYLPPEHRPGLPCWILLHGVTVPGWHHAALRRMAHALAACGHVAVAPRIPGWERLEVRPQDTSPAIEDAIRSLRRWGVDEDRVGVMAFSVAATWAVEVAAREGETRFSAVAGMGGYGDLHGLIRGMVVGEHEWRGEAYRHDPDPYGRWIMGASLLPLLEGDSYGQQHEREQAGRALRTLALTAGRAGIYSGEPVYDTLIADLREQVPKYAHPAWDILAPPSLTPVPDREGGRELAHVLAEAGGRSEPMLDPRGRLGHLGTPVTLLHGRGDHLVPWSETLRLASELPAATRRNVTLTRLLGHTKRGEAGALRNPLVLGGEVAGFARWAHAVVTALDRRDR